MQASELVHWQCVRPEHRRAAATGAGATLTIHQGEWARCPAEPSSGDHEWRRVAGQALRSLMAGVDPADPSEQPA
ncbi:MAG TPA: hypothetical protein VM070_00465 [Candidatus Saccharimonadales bacterium]|nr:hypothetical protein [Candidatus Saccharimonadales bacterium]